jgi:hypothetical protein
MRPIGVLLAAIQLAICALATPCRATEPTTFSIVQPAQKPAQIALGGKLTVRVNGDSALDKTKVELRIGDHLLGVQPEWIPDVRELHFDLVRTDGSKSNRATWVALIGSPFANANANATVGMTYDGKALSYKKTDGKTDEVESSTLPVAKFSIPMMVLGLLTAFAIVAVTIGLGATTSMLRDAETVPQIPIFDRPFSLGRCQMAVWMILVMSSFVFIFALLLDLASLNTESFALIGISAATGLGAVAIDVSKNASATAAVAALRSMNIASASDVQNLKGAVANNGGAAATTVVPNAVVPGIAIPTVAQLWTAYLNATTAFRSEGLLKDLLNDVSGPTIHRFQIVAWTIILGAIYVGMVYTNLETPVFGNNLLALMGISGGVYLGFKIPEKQG